MASTSPLGTCRRGVQRMFCEFLTGRHCSPRKKTWQFAGICVKRRVSVYVLDDFARCLGFGADYYISSATGFIRSLFVNGQYIPGVGTPGHQICAPKCWIFPAQMIRRMVCNRRFPAGWHISDRAATSFDTNCVETWVRICVRKQLFFRHQYLTGCTGYVFQVCSHCNSIIHLFKVCARKTCCQSKNVRKYEPPKYAHLAVRSAPEQAAQTTGLWWTICG